MVLKEVDSDVETRQYIKNRLKYPRNKKRLGAKRDASNTEKNFAAEDDKEKTEKPRFPRKRSYKKVKVEEENNSLNTEVQVRSFAYHYLAGSLMGEALVIRFPLSLLKLSSNGSL